MSFASNVAPKRRVLSGKPGPWLCPEDGRLNQGFVIVCLTPGCREERPKPGANSTA